MTLLQADLFVYLFIVINIIYKLFSKKLSLLFIIIHFDHKLHKGLQQQNMKYDYLYCILFVLWNINIGLYK